MSLEIRTYTVEQAMQDRGLFAGLADPNGFLKPCDDQWFSLVAKNPHQQADDLAMVLAIDGEKVVGRLGFFAAQVRINGVVHRTHWTDGFFLDPRYKSSGAGAMILLRSMSSCKSICAAGGPDESAQKLYKASGFKYLGAMRRFAYFYDPRVITATLFGDKSYRGLASLFVPVGLWAYYLIKPTGKPTLQFNEVESFNDDLNAVLSTQTENSMVRDVASLNWILEHRQAYPFELRYDGKLVGYLLLKKYHHKGGGKRNVPAVDVGCILDYYVEPGLKALVSDLVRFGIQFFKDKQVALFEFNVFDPDLAITCKKFGMKDWEGTLAFVKPPPGVKIDSESRWFLTPGAADMILMKP